MLALFTKIILSVSIWILKLIDSIYIMFSYAAGVKKISFTNGSKMSLIEGIAKQPMIYNIFLSMFVIGVSLGGIFCIYSILKNIVKIKKSNGKIVTQYLMSVFGILLVFVAFILVIQILGIILGSIQDILYKAAGDNLSTGNSIIKLITENSIHDSQKEAFNKLWLADENKNIGIYQANFINNLLGEFRKEGAISLNWTFNGGIINYHKFPSFILLVVSCLIGFSMISSLVQLLVRVYKLMTMLLVSPLSISTLPLDDGLRFDEWKKEIVSEIFLAYGSVLSVNIVLILIKVISSISIPNADSMEIISGSSTSMLSILNTFKSFLLASSGFAIKATQGLIAKIMGVAGDKGSSKSMGATAAGGLGTAAGIAKGAGKVAFGKPDTADKVISKLGKAGAISTPTSKGGRFSGIGKSNIFSATKKGGLLGAGLNIASKLGRATFGKGSGAKLLKNAKGRAKNTKDKFLNTKLGGKAKSFKDNVSKHGLAGLGARSIKHGMARAKNLKGNAQ